MNAFEIKEKIESAFIPYTCVAEIWDFQRKIKFRISDKDDTDIFIEPEMATDSLKNQSALSAYIENVKDKIASISRRRR